MATSFFRRSLGQDEVDHYSSTWAVFLFFLLVLVSLMMSLNLTLMDHNTPQAASPKVKANCWQPAQFEDSQVQYTNTFCTDIANGLLNGVKPKQYSFSMENRFVKKGEEKNISSENSSQEDLDEQVERRGEQLAKNEKIREKTRELVDFRAPVVLAVLALCLRLPGLLCSLISNSMTSGINVEKTLESCVESRSLDAASQKQIQEEIATALSESFSQSRNSASGIYLFMKVLALLVLLGETLFIGHFLMPDIHAMEMDIAKDNLSGHWDAPHGTTAGDKDNSTTKALFVYPNNIFHCGFEIRSLTNVHAYTVQCIITREEPQSESNAGGGGGSVSHTMATRKTLMLYQALFTVVLAVLAVLLVANAISTVSWFLKMYVSSFPTSFGLPSDAARDLIFLVHMAWMNADPRVARSLAGSSVRSRGDVGEKDRKSDMVEITA